MSRVWAAPGGAERSDRHGAVCGTSRTAGQRPECSPRAGRRALGDPAVVATQSEVESAAAGRCLCCDDRGGGRDRRGRDFWPPDVVGAGRGRSGSVGRSRGSDPSWTRQSGRLPPEPLFSGEPFIDTATLFSTADSGAVNTAVTVLAVVPSTGLRPQLDGRVLAPTGQSGDRRGAGRGRLELHAQDCKAFTAGSDRDGGGHLRTGVDRSRCGQGDADRRGCGLGQDGWDPYRQNRRRTETDENRLDRRSGSTTRHLHAQAGNLRLLLSERHEPGREERARHPRTIP